MVTRGIAMRERRPADAGAVAVEFALVLVPLMVVVMGIIGFGIVFSQKQALSNAARDAARAGVVTYATPITCTNLVDQAKADSETIGLNPNDVTVTVSRGAGAETVVVCSSSAPSSTRPCVGAAESGTLSQLTVEVEYASHVDLFFADPTFNLTGTGTFRCEYTL